MNERPGGVLRQVIAIFMIAAFVWFVVIILVERWALLENIQPLGNTSIDDWVDDFMIASIYTFWLTIFFVLLWYVLTLYVFNVVKPMDGNKRGVWIGMGVAAGILSAFCGVELLERPDSNVIWPYLLFPGNSLLIYYWSTLLATPGPFKYIPWGARVLRPYRLL